MGQGMVVGWMCVITVVVVSGGVEARSVLTRGDWRCEYRNCGVGQECELADFGHDATNVGVQRCSPDGVIHSL